MGDDYDYSNITDDFFDYDSENPDTIMYVVTCIIISIGLPLTLVAIYALYSQVRNDQVAPIYIINLLISDLLQFICMIIQVVRVEDWMTSEIFSYIYLSCLIASIGFMVCVALERYLVIAHPLWYHFRQTSKTSVVVCVVVWILPLVPVLINVFVGYPQVTETVFAILLLLLLPLFIFFLGGTLKALSASRLPSDEKRRIVGIVVLVLLIYTLLFLPTIILILDTRVNNETLRNVSFMFLKLSPLADLVLYFFVRKGAIDKLLASVCCCRMDSSDVDTSTV